MTVSCDVCNRAESDQPAALMSWTATRSGAGVRYTCPSCTRDQVRVIEANLVLGVS